MKKKNKIPREHTGRDVNFHGRDRAETRTTFNNGHYDKIPKMESMRKAIWRGPNDCGDSTSFGYYRSGEPSRKYMQRLLDHHIGKSYDEFYSKMCKKFTGRDRYQLDSFIKYEFGGNVFYWYNTPKYGIENGLIVKYR